MSKTHTCDSDCNGIECKKYKVTNKIETRYIVPTTIFIKHGILHLKKEKLNNMKHYDEKESCNCKEISCKIDCKRNHTHKTFDCEYCKSKYDEKESGLVLDEPSLGGMILSVLILFILIGVIVYLF